MNRREALLLLKKEFETLETAEIRHSLRAVLGISQAEIYLDPEKELTDAEEKQLQELICRRKQAEPLAYILGEWDFMGLTLSVNKNVLIPRQDTETLAEDAIAYAKKTGAKNALDICTGSGCIALSLKAALRDMEVTASDISKEALAVAKENAERNGLAVNFIESDLFADIEGIFDIITANPPYIAFEEYMDLQPEIIFYEPQLALVAEENGLYFYRKIAEEAKKYLCGRIFLEVGFLQAEAVSEFLAENGYTEIYTLKDLGGIDRVVSGKYVNR